MGIFDKFNKDELLDKAKSTIDNTTQAVKGKVEETRIVINRESFIFCA